MRLTVWTRKTKAGLGDFWTSWSLIGTFLWTNRNPDKQTCTFRYPNSHPLTTENIDFLQYTLPHIYIYIYKYEYIWGYVYMYIYTSFTFPCIAYKCPQYTLILRNCINSHISKLTALYLQPFPSLFCLRKVYVFQRSLPFNRKRITFSTVCSF